MIESIRSRRRNWNTRSVVMAVIMCGAVSAQAQWYRLNQGSISVGGTGQFSTQLTDNQGTAGNYAVPFKTGATTYSTSISGQQQFTTMSAGFLTSLQWHPAPWAGVQLNYGFTHYQERYGFNYGATTPAAQTVHVPTDMHEFTGAYQFHARKIPFQPFVNVGGGAIDFTPSVASNQWRIAGLLETGWDLPVKHSRFGFRVSGRVLVYRSPNFNTPAISTRSWRATEEPSVSTYYRF